MRHEHYVTKNDNGIRRRPEARLRAAEKQGQEDRTHQLDVPGLRLVEAVADGGPDTELGEGEEAEDVPEEPVDAEVAFGEDGDERSAVGEPGNDVDDVAECPDAGCAEHARHAALSVEHHDASFSSRPKRRAADGAILSTDGMLTCQPLKMKKTAAKMQPAAAR